MRGLIIISIFVTQSPCAPQIIRYHFYLVECIYTLEFILFSLFYQALVEWKIIQFYFLENMDHTMSKAISSRKSILLLVSLFNVIKIYIIGGDCEFNCRKTAYYHMYVVSKKHVSYDCFFRTQLKLMSSNLHNHE